MTIIKIGGGDSINLDAITDDLKSVDGPFLIVHGANALRDALAEKLGIEKKVLTSISGVDSVYSDEQAIDLQMMAYAGLANKRLVSLCQQKGVNAIGLSGLDGRIIQGRRNTGIRVREKGKNRIVRDLSGKPASINNELLNWLIDSGYVPVLCVPIASENGGPLNSENDDIVAVLQQATTADTVIHLIEAPGFLADPGDESTVMNTMSAAEIAKACDESTGRIKRKLLSIKRLLDNNTKRIIITDGRVASPIARALQGEGTTIQ